MNGGLRCANPTYEAVLQPISRATKENLASRACSYKNREISRELGGCLTPADTISLPATIRQSKRDRRGSKNGENSCISSIARQSLQPVYAGLPSWH